MFTPEQIHKALEFSTPNMKAMLLLAIDGGMGNSDLAAMPISAIDFESGWMNYPRPKTAIDRKIPLWPETIDAIKTMLAQRHEGKTPGRMPSCFSWGYAARIIFAAVMGIG